MEIECVLEKLRTEDSQKAIYLKYKFPESVQGNRIFVKFFTIKFIILKKF